MSGYQFLEKFTGRYSIKKNILENIFNEFQVKVHVIDEIFTKQDNFEARKSEV